MTRRRKSNTGNRQGRASPTADQTQSQSQNQAQNQVPTQRQWYKVDLHLHTPASKDYEDPKATYLDWVRAVVDKDLDIVAITDHNTVAGVRAIRQEIEWLTRLEEEGRLTEDERTRLVEWKKLAEKVLLLPGFEFTATFGFHILGIFPPDISVRQLEHILLRLNVPEEKLDEGSTETGAGVDVLSAYKIIQESGGIVIAAHANSTHGVAMRNFPFGGQTKIAYTQDPNLDALEVTDLERRGRSTARFFNGSKTEYPRRMHCIQGSDAHRVVFDKKQPKRLGIGDRTTELSLAEPTFEAIQELLHSSNFERTRPARAKDEPFDPLIEAREEGPGMVLSFQESASQRAGRLTMILNDLCAFANTMGGTLFVGAGPRAKSKPKGLEDPKQVEKEIREAIEERITPALEIKCDTIQSGSVNILRIQVEKGADRPYCVDDYKFYIRDESDTNLAVRDEIVALVNEVLQPRNSRRGSGGRGDNRDNRGGNRNRQGGNNRPPRRRRGRHNNDNGDNNRNGNQEFQNDDSIATEEGLELDALVNGVSEPSGGSSEDDTFRLPQVGVEIIQTAKRKGGNAHIIRDLRNGRTIKNVTRKGARRLWNYAIQQHEDNPVDPARIEWNGDIGLVGVERRAGKVRYDLALRESNSDSDIRIFYGVTEDGMDGRWSSFILDE